MKVCELIRELQNWNGDQEVYFAYPANDYWNSTVVSEVVFTDRKEIVWSEYFDGYELPKKDYEPDTGDDIRDVIVLS